MVMREILVLGSFSSRRLLLFSTASRTFCAVQFSRRMVTGGSFGLPSGPSSVTRGSKTIFRLAWRARVLMTSTKGASSNETIGRTSPVDSAGAASVGAAGLASAADWLYSFWTFSSDARSEEHTSELQSPDHLV